MQITEVLHEQTSKLPQKQKEHVKQCFAASVKKKCFHYSKMWILVCIMMKTKSSRLYDHIRDNEILALPSKFTIKTIHAPIPYTAQHSDSAGKCWKN